MNAAVGTAARSAPTAARIVREIARHLDRRGAWAGYHGSLEAEARLLLEEVGVDPRGDAVVPPAALGRITELLRRRLDGEPLAHVLGWTRYRGLRLACPPGTFVPRNAVGHVLDEVLAPVPVGGRVAEVGTGVGAVAIAVALARPDVRVVATDVAPAAVEAARANVASHGVGARVDVRAGDLLGPLDGAGPFDLVLANLPYVPDAVAPRANREARHEPAAAIFRPADGLDLVRALVAGAPGHLAPHGRLVLEVGPGQRSHVHWMLAGRGTWLVDGDRRPLGLVDVGRHDLVR